MPCVFSRCPHVSLVVPRTTLGLYFVFDGDDLFLLISFFLTSAHKQRGFDAGFAVQLDGTNADYYNNLATVVGSSGANSEVFAEGWRAFAECARETRHWITIFGCCVETPRWRIGVEVFRRGLWILGYYGTP